MSLTPAMLDAMLAADCTAEQIAAVVKADLAERDCRLASKRQKDAERQRKHRDPNTLSRDVTVTSVTERDPSLPLPPNENNSNPPTPTHPDNNPRARKGAVAKPDGVQDQTWSDFRQLRKQKRADLTETALAAIAREARNAGWSLEAALAECVARGWQAFKADWVKDAPKPSANGPGPKSPMVAAMMARKAREVSG